MAMSLEDLARFHSAEAQALLAKYRQVEYLIGKGTHNASDGDYCEDLVRAFLRPVVPGRYAVDTGFIRNSPYAAHPDKGNVSPQLDVIIHDTVDFSPIFRSGEFVVVMPAAVVGVVEVKKTLDSDNLNDAMDNLAFVREMARLSSCPPPRPFMGLFAFTADEKLCPQSKAVSDTYLNAFRRIGVDHASAKALLPDAVVVADQHVFLRMDAHEHMHKPVIVRHNPAEVRGINIAGQALLCLLAAVRKFPEWGNISGRFEFPDDLPGEEVFRLEPNN